MKSIIYGIDFYRIFENETKLNSSGIWGSRTNALREKYEIEIHEARHIIDDTTRDRAASELRAKRAEEELLKLREK